MPRILLSALDQDRSLAQTLLTKLAQYYQSIGLLSDDPTTATKSIASADMLLVLITQNWADGISQDRTQADALTDSLRRSDLPVVAVLYDGAQLPPVASLPTEHRALAYMNAMNIAQGESFDADALTLAQQMASILKDVSPEGFDAQMGRASSPKKRPPALPFNLFIIGVALLLGVLVVAIPRLRGDERPEPATTPRFNENVTTRLTGHDLQIGIVASLTNDADLRGLEMYNGVQLALIDRPTVQVGEVAHTVDVLSQDTTCTASGGIATANIFSASPDVMAVIGAECEETCKASATIYDRAGMTVISPACTSPILTQETHASFSRTIPSQAYTARASAEYALANGWMTAVVIHDEQLVGRQLAHEFRNAYDAEGVITFISVETNTLSISRLTEEILSASPQMIYFAGRESNITDLRTSLILEGAGDIPFMAGILSDIERFISMTGKDADDVLVAILDVPNHNMPNSPQYDSLRARYVAQFGAEPTSSIFAYAYDATIMLLDTIQTIGVTGDDGRVYIERTALQTAIRQYRGQGVTGQIACDTQGDCAELRYTVYRLREGELVPVARD